MDSKQQRSKKDQEISQVDSKKSLIISSVIATLIAITPYLFYLHESVPVSKVWNTFLFSYDSKGWGDANFAMWVFTGKAIPLMLLIIWFFTNRHWWYHVLLVPIAMYVYQIFQIFNENITYIDEFQLIYMVPIMAIIIPSVYLIRARIFNTINEASKSMQELEDELKVSPKGFWAKIKQYF